MIDIAVSDRWRATFPGAHVGFLLLGGIDNTPRPTPLDAQKRAVEAQLRATFGGKTRAELLEHPVLRAYRSYYKQFDKTYHVQLQLESIVNGGKSLPDVSPLVDASFAAELETLVLTASHDADLLVGPIRIDATQGDERFVQRGGTQRTLKPKDMLMADAEGVVCTILYGQDARTPISPATRRALYVAYAPAGVPRASVEQQLAALQANVLLAAPAASVELLKIADASPEQIPA